MAKYNYDKKALKGFGIGPFLNQVKARKKHIEEADDKIPNSIFNPNKIAAALHPEFIWGKVIKVIRMPLGATYIIAPAVEKGFKELPDFHPCQYVTVELDTPEALTRRNYCITSTPTAAKGEHGIYQLVVSSHGPGHASEFILNNWKEGDFIKFSAPVGEMYYDPIRDSKEILSIGIGGPSVSLCGDIAERNLDICVTAVCIIPVPQALGVTDMYKALGAKTGGKIKCVPVLLNGEAEGCEKGPITPDLIKKIMTDPATGKIKDMTVMISAPDPICSMIEGAVRKAGVPQRRILKEVQGDETPVFTKPDYPGEKVVKQFKLKVWIRGECAELDCSSDKTIAQVVEAARIRLKTSCRGGHCGMCHSRLISGNYYMPKSVDGRKEADRKFGWIHPCCTYPLSDMEIEVFPEYEPK